MSERCNAQLNYRGKRLTCTGWSEELGHTHSCDGVYWGKDETELHQCTETAEYCGEQLRCDYDAPCKNYHGARSKQFGDICWNDEKRPQPAVMFVGLGMGHRLGSYQTDAQMLAAATMQDAINRSEYLESKRRK